METITIAKSEYEKMKSELEKLKYLKEIDFNLVRQFLQSKEDLKYGRFKRLA